MIGKSEQDLAKQIDYLQREVRKLREEVDNLKKQLKRLPPPPTPMYPPRRI